MSNENAKFNEAIANILNSLSKSEDIKALEDSFKENYEKEYVGIQLVGSSVQTYYHFSSYSVPDENGNGIYLSKKDMPFRDFIMKIYDYYHDKKSLNRDYGDDLRDQNATKRFVIKRINEDSFSVGLKYLEENFTGQFSDF